MPSRNTVAPPIDRKFGKYFQIEDRRGDPPSVDGAANLCGLPAVTVPHGFGQLHLPTGVQFVGRAWSEQRILSVAHAYQLRTSWHTLVPGAEH
jgi:aspartyl-tRNA(Asn)/glutamyl-tRNA(Gln) amidotransferase subunit A